MATFAERINAARSTSSPFSGQVVFGLVDHAKWQLNPDNAEHPGVTPEKQALAELVKHNPDAYAWRFGVWIITQPSYASFDLAAIPDETVLNDVVATFGVFAPVLPE